MSPQKIREKTVCLILSWVVLFVLIFPIASVGQHAVDSLLLVDDAKKVEEVHQWYRKIRKRYDSTVVLGQLQELKLKAEQANDKICLAAAEFYRGQYEAIVLERYESGERLMEKGIQIAESNRQELQKAYYRHHFGYYYFFKRKDYGLALRYMVRANYAFSQVGYENIEEQGYHLYQLAFVYYHLRNYHQALHHLKTALRYPIDNHISHVYILNTIGQCHRKLYELDSALYYFDQTHKLAEKYGDTVWVGIASGNMGSVYILQQEFRKAEPYLTTYYDYSLSSKDSMCIADALVNLSSADLGLGRDELALKRLHEALGIFKRSPFRMFDENYLMQIDLYRNLSVAYDKLNRPAEALHYLKLANEVSDSLEKRSLIAGSEATQQQLDAEQHMSELKLLEEEKSNAVMRQYFLIVCIVLIGIIVFMVYNRQMLKARKDRELREEKNALLESEKKRVEEELLYSKQLLQNYTENLRHKNELLEQVQSEIQALREVHGNDMAPQELYLNSLNQSTILTDDEWLNFRQLFDKVYPGFFVRLKEKYPEITPAETRLMALTKLKLSNKEMAGMLGISTDAIKKTRQRLRKKIITTEEMDIEELVESI